MLIIASLIILSLADFGNTVFFTRMGAKGRDGRGNLAAASATYDDSGLMASHYGVALGSRLDHRSSGIFVNVLSLEKAYRGAITDLDYTRTG